MSRFSGRNFDVSILGESWFTLSLQAPRLVMNQLSP